MNLTDSPRLLPDAVAVPFSQVERALQPRAGTRDTPAPALTATVVVIGEHSRLCEAAEALDHLAGSSAVRAILISGGSNPSPAVRVAGQTVAIEGLVPRYLDNVVAALRLSSLPTVVWWRGGSPEAVEGVAELADRLLLDVEEPAALWARAGALTSRTALGDIRWTRLTRWRALMAHFFDIPEVRNAAPAFTRLQIEGADEHTARLFAAWLASALQWDGRVRVELRTRSGAAPLERVRLGDGTQDLELTMAPSRTCVRTAVHVEGHPGANRIVSLGDQSLAAFLAEELRVRSRDHAFEQALAAIGGGS